MTWPVLVPSLTITAMATQGLSAFNLDFVGLKVRSITVNGIAAKWSRVRGEMTVKPAAGHRTASRPTGSSMPGHLGEDGSLTVGPRDAIATSTAPADGSSPAVLVPRQRSRAQAAPSRA